MARGSKEKYTPKQKRMAQHIEESAKKRGYSAKRAAQIGWATTNKETGGAGKEVTNTAPSKKGGHKGGLARSSHAARVRAAKKGWETRRAHAH
ncbi:MAG: plasmid stabilization protein [Pseudobdellovibrionaceae bacterium]